MDPTGEIANILAMAGFGGIIGGAAGFAGGALSQIGSGRKFDWRKAWGSAANGAVVGAAKGALIGSGAGIPLAFATDFAAGSLGNAFEQGITTGRVDLRESLISGAGNAVSELLYGTGELTSAKDAFIRGARTGAAMSGLQNLEEAFGLRGAGRDPKGMCGSPDPFDLASGLENGRGYHTGNNPSRMNGGSGFSLGGFAWDVATGAVIGGLGSAAFYGVGKAVDALKESIIARMSGTERMLDPYVGVKQASEYLRSKGVPRSYRKQVLESFDVATIEIQIAKDNTFGLRFYGGGNANVEGRYLFETFTPLTNRQNLALPYEWNSMMGIQQFQVKKGTTMITGRAAAQTNLGGQYIGGAKQWYINDLEDLIRCQ